jgi:hypothetical protein
MTNLICISCKHHIKNRFCEAFPDKEGIPEEISNGKNDHSKPLKDQENDIVFEEIEDNGK